MDLVERIAQVIRSVPRGQVASYGQIAGLAGSPRAARLVGQVLRRSASDLPWQRIVNKDGRISIVNMAFPAELQVELLRAEGVVVEKIDSSYQVNLVAYRFDGAPLLATVEKREGDEKTIDR